MSHLAFPPHLNPLHGELSSENRLILHFYFSLFMDRLNHDLYPTELEKENRAILHKSFVMFVFSEGAEL